MHFTSNIQFCQPNTSQENTWIFWRQQAGLATLIAVIALSVFSLLGLVVSLNTTTEVRISDNYESRQQADLAARTGLNHARELLRGVDFTDLLVGPDGVGTSTYPSSASGRYAFRNWIDLSTARSLNILDPTSAVSSLPDDGLFNTGKSGTTNGTILVPKIGIAMTAPDPYGSGTVMTARYFLKVTNNPEDTCGPFKDCDGIIIVRSTGVAQAIPETGGGTVRANSVAVYEARYKAERVFDLDFPTVIEGDLVLPAASNMFNGNSFMIDGKANLYGIATIDTNTSDLIHPADLIRALLSPTQYDQVTGQCCKPAIGDITASLTGDNLLLLDPAFIWNMAYNLIPKFADNVYQGNATWGPKNPPPWPIGSYDPSKGTEGMKITYINGDLDVSGSVSGAGILCVTGNLKITGSFTWSGLMLVIGKGSVSIGGSGAAVDGGLFLANLQAGNPPRFGTPQFSMGGNSNFQERTSALQVSIKLLPPREISRREVTSLMDP